MGVGETAPSGQADSENGAEECGAMQVQIPHLYKIFWRVASKKILSVQI